MGLIGSVSRLSGCETRGWMKVSWNDDCRVYLPVSPSKSDTKHLDLSASSKNISSIAGASIFYDFNKTPTIFLDLVASMGRSNGVNLIN